MLHQGRCRLVINVDDLRSYNRAYATGLLDEPNEYLPAFDMALRALVGKMDFKCVLLPNAPVATAGEEEEFGNGEKRKEKSVALEEGERPELRLWGLTLGITL